MGEWTILERLLEAAVQQHSTMIGRSVLLCFQNRLDPSHRLWVMLG